ncbi:Lsr2 family protein [Nakamurella silvestris]|nr:Lsr2 family protein [Nakamurella silvestris]
MAQHTTVELVDDLTGGKASTTVAFGLDGSSYEIDLNKRNEAALRKILTEFVGAAREVKEGPAPKATPAPARPRARKASVPAEDRKDKLGAIRVWAEQNGVQVATRGRISADVQKQFDDAQAGRPIFSAAP